MEILLKEWNLLDCNSCETPIGGEELKKADSEPMGAGEATVFRRAAARVNYLSQDRPDLNVASRMFAMRMAQPKKGDEAILRGS